MVKKGIPKKRTKKNDFREKHKREIFFSVLQEEDTEPVREEEEPPPQIVKIDKDEKKICEGIEKRENKKSP